MNRLSKMMAVFMTAALLASAPGVTPFAAFAVTLGQGTNIGVRTTNINTGNVTGSRLGSGGSSVGLRTTQGVSVKGTLGNNSDAPVVTHSERVVSGVAGLPNEVVSEVTSVGLNGEAIVSPMALPGHEAVPFQSVQGFGLPYNDLIIGSQDTGVKSNGMERVTTPEMDVQGGRVKFDGSSMGLKSDEVPTVAVDGMTEVGNASLKPYEADAAAGASQVPPASVPTSSEKSSKKLSTFIDAVVIGGATALTQYFTSSWEASAAMGYAAMVFVGRYRYSPDFMKVKSDEKYGKLGGAARFVLLSAMTLVAAPVAFTVESYQHLIKPFISTVWEFVKDIGRAIKNAAVWVYDNVLVPVARAIRDFARASWEMVKNFARAAWELVKDIATAIKNFVVDMARAIKDAAVWVYDNVIVPVAEAVRNFFKAAWELVKDLAKAVKELVISFYENVLTPIGHGIRALGAGAIAGVVAAFAVTLPFLGSMGVNFIVRPIHNLFEKTGTWPLAFKIAAGVVIPAGLVLAALSLPVLQGLLALTALTVGGSMLVGFFGGAITAIKEAYGNGFVEGISKGVGDAWKLATGSYSTAKSNYANWRMNIMK